MASKITYITSYRTSDKVGLEPELINTYARPLGLEVVCLPLPAVTERAELVQKSIQGTQFDVVELGSTFTKDFIALNTLRPFQPAEVERMGGADAFVKPAWQFGLVGETVWAIPLFTDVRLVFYRRDLLAKAGIDEQTAFQSPANFTDTLRQLTQAGIAAPWTAPTMASLMTTQSLASWIWSHGSDFLDEENRKVLLDQPEVIAAVQEYFGLHEYLGPERALVDQNHYVQKFLNGQAAVMIDGAYSLPNYCLKNPLIKDHVGIAAPLGHAFVGGSCLAVWQQSQQEQSAIDLIQLLTSPEFQIRYHELLGRLPSRTESLMNIPLPDDGFRQTILQALQTGRQLPSFSVWGLVDDRLAKIFAHLWAEILAAPHPDVNQLVEKELLQATRQLNLVLSQY